MQENLEFLFFHFAKGRRSYPQTAPPEWLLKQRIVEIVELVLQTVGNRWVCGPSLEILDIKSKAVFTKLRFVL